MDPGLLLLLRQRCRGRRPRLQGHGARLALRQRQCLALVFEVLDRAVISPAVVRTLKRFDLSGEITALLFVLNHRTLIRRFTLFDAAHLFLCKLTPPFQSRIACRRRCHGRSHRAVCRSLVRWQVAMRYGMVRGGRRNQRIKRRSTEPPVDSDSDRDDR